MKFRWWYGIVLNMILAALVISGAALYVVHGKGKNRILEIRDSASGRVYSKWRMEEAEEFAIEFIHSVHQSPVRESFTIEDGMIRPTTVRFNSFGAGMQSDIEEGQTLSRDGDSLVLSGFNTLFKELNYTVGTAADHLLFIKGKTIRLQELCGKNAHIVIRYYGGNDR